MDRFKNYGLWVSVFALIGLILGNYGLYSKLGLNADSYKQIVDAILTVFVMAGIVNNPTSGQGYLDNKQNK
ncbi:hypothetical protein HMPREF1982_03564 [Clostridiales bacterium oral taxon 876 str. F0540]|nr:hypothetical protein HMPREF1982_03564 [Clostridiales bacterium oral taxon 876 str. F0540]